jgi:hypothetical protein
MTKDQDTVNIVAGALRFFVHDKLRPLGGRVVKKDEGKNLGQEKNRGENIFKRRKQRGKPIIRGEDSLGRTLFKSSP